MSTARLRELQSEYVRMHFRAPTGGDRPEFPAFAAPSHQAEVFGRRVLLAVELLKRFPRTLEKLADGAPKAPRLAESALLRAFCASEHFFDPRHALPSAEGVGRGYENASKFYFWLAPRAEGAARELLRLEFAIFLLVQASAARDRYFERFRGGLFWRTPHGRVEALAPDFRTFSARDGAPLRRELRRAGMFDLDRVRGRNPKVSAKQKGTL